MYRKSLFQNLFKYSFIMTGHLPSLSLTGYSCFRLIRASKKKTSETKNEKIILVSSTNRKTYFIVKKKKLLKTEL